jgi:hypothetical protein
MNWDAISAIAEIVSSVGVVISLVYLAIQIRSQTKETSLASNEELTRQVESFYGSLSENEDLARIWLAGGADYDSLDSVEKVRYRSLCGRFSRIVESNYLRHRRGRGDEGTWSGLELSLREILATTPGFRSWWVIRGHWLNPDFQKLINKLIEEIDSQPPYSHGQDG